MDKTLLPEIKEFLSETGMGPSYFGKASCGNSEIVKRLSNNRKVWPETAQRIRAFMKAYRQRAAARVAA